MICLRLRAATLLAAVLSAHLWVRLEAALIDHAADINDTTSAEDNARAAYNARHEQYPVDVRRFAFHSRILGRAGQSRTGDWKQAQDLKLCGLLSDKVQSQLETAREGTWFKSSDGHFFWEPACCRLRILNGPQVRQCLQGRHIVFVGDSISRYTYLNLCHFLATNKYMLQYGQGPVPSLNDEREFGDWDRFFNEGPQHLATEAVNASVHESCKCRHGRVGAFHTSAHEDRRFVLTEQALPANTSDAGLRLYEGNAVEGDMLIRVSFYLVFASPTVEQAGKAAITHALTHLPATPSALVMNMGIWCMDGTPMDELVPMMRKVLQHAVDVRTSEGLSTRLLWKSTTATIKGGGIEQDWAKLNDAVIELLEEIKPWGLVDVRALTTSAIKQGLTFYSFDEIHFYAGMYEQFNELLLNVLCDMNNTFAAGQADHTPADTSSQTRS